MEENKQEQIIIGGSTTGAHDHILTLSVDSPDAETDLDVQIINTPDDMQYFVADVNSDGIYDTVLDDTGTEMDGISDGALLADEDMDADDGVAISDHADVQVIGPVVDEDFAVVDTVGTDPAAVAIPDEDPFPAGDPFSADEPFPAGDLFIADEHFPADDDSSFMAMQ